MTAAKCGWVKTSTSACFLRESKASHAAYEKSAIHPLPHTDVQDLRETIRPSLRPRQHGQLCSLGLLMAVALNWHGIVWTLVFVLLWVHTGSRKWPVTCSLVLDNFTRKQKQPLAGLIERHDIKEALSIILLHIQANGRWLPMIQPQEKAARILL